MSAISVEGFGSVTWWGFTPALDLTRIAKDGYAKRPVETSLEHITIDSDHLNILLVGSGDLRHVLTSLANASHYTSKPIHFYVAESCLEVFARHMLFLALLFEPTDKLGLQEKAELFLELFGNSLVRAQTADYLRQKANDLIKMVTDLDYLRDCIPMLDISAMKFKERDLLEGIFKFWRHPDESTFDIRRHWEGRLRHYLGVRYDARSGVFDWDYNMKLTEMAPVIGSHEYTEWREGGVAFHLRDDAPYEAINRTLASGTILTKGDVTQVFVWNNLNLKFYVWELGNHDNQAGGERVPQRGYWGDIVNSPYLAFGIKSDNKELFKTVNGKHVKTSANVSEHNLLSLIHTLTTGERYTDQPSCGRDGNMAVIEELPVRGEEEPKHSGLGQKAEPQRSEELQGPLFSGSHKITFLPLGSMSEIGKKAKFKNLFSIMYFSNSMVHHLTSGIESVMGPTCTLVLETARYMLDLKKEQREQFVKKVTGMATSLGFKNALHSSEDGDYLAFSRDVS